LMAVSDSVAYDHVQCSFVGAPSSSLQTSPRTGQPPASGAHGRHHETSSPARATTWANFGLCGEPRDGGYLIPVEVVFVRERDNQFDRNAFRAEVKGRLVGYLPRHIAAQLAGPLDKGRCESFSVCGVMRGGSLKAPTIGVHVWLDRRPSPGPLLSHADDAATVKWPPSGTEGVQCSADERN
jgi:HIRAN domain